MPMMKRSLYACLMAGGALALGACVGPDANLDRTASLNPLSRYVLQVEPDVDRIALAVHADSLSPNQRAALAALAGRYRASGSDKLVIQVSNQGTEATQRMAGHVLHALESQGVSRDRIALESYSAPGANAPVLAGFNTVRAQVPQCGTQWGNLSSTAQNSGASNFGCAVNANLAAQIADPNDIRTPRAMTPPSAQRRTVVFEAYRQGNATSAAPEPLLTAAQVSNVVE